jgi:hypothetical protein
MNTLIAGHELHGSAPITVELLSIDDCRSISGGGPLAVGALLLGGGLAMTMVGVIVGVAIYALTR